jgi:cellulose biosynthesis protein BcsQ
VTQPTITVLANHKGGVGKTFVLTLLAAELAQRGHSVLAVDLDPQGNLSRRMGYLEHDLESRPSVAEALNAADKAATLKSALLPCQWEPDWAERITLAPSRIELENRVAEAGVPGAWMRLQEAVVPVSSPFEHVLIDVAPTLGHLLHLALVCADRVVIPAAPEYDSVRGAQRLMEFLKDEKYRNALGLRCEVAGVVINSSRSGVATHTSRIELAISSWGDLVWQPVIPLRAALADTQEHAEPPHAAGGETGLMIRTAAKQLVDTFLQER